MRRSPARWTERRLCMSTTPPRQALRDLLNRHELVIAPGVFDGISAQLARRTGHAAAYLTGAGVAASGYGLPDIGLVTQTEMTERARMIVAALGDVPLIADADTGYGAGLNVVRTVRQYDDAGLAAAIERANRYARAGADIIFIEAPQGIDEIERIAREVDAPLLINLVLGGMTPLQSTARLQELGYAIPIHPSNPLARDTFAMLEGLCELNGGNPADFAPPTPADFFNLVGMAEWRELDEHLAGKEVVSWA